MYYYDETLDVTGRIWEMKYVNTIFQTNISSIYNQSCFTHFYICSDHIQIKILPY